jgi:hypothetical protein
MTGRLAHIIRHPIKSIGHEEIPAVSLNKGHGLPFDRVWAISHEAAAFDSPLTEWASKRNFVRGVAAPQLMAVTARVTDEGLALDHPGQWHVTLDPDCPEDQTKLIEWVRPFWPENRPAPRAVERAADISLSDMREPYVSILSLASLAQLSEAAGQNVSIHRFRGNLWIDGWEPGAERNLIGKRLKIGGATLDIEMPITRCRATCANPETGAEDLEMLELLQSLWGNHQFGLYARVLEGGDLFTGDPVEVL